MGTCSSAALKINPPFQHYNATTKSASFICLSSDDVEWLNPNFTILVSTPDNRITGM